MDGFRKVQVENCINCRHFDADSKCVPRCGKGIAWHRDESGTAIYGYKNKEHPQESVCDSFQEKKEK